MCALETYDGLNRLTDYDRGDLNGSLNGISTLSFAQEWTLKALGNWVEFRENANASTTDSDFTDATDLDQDRTHNGANEITGITEVSGQVAWATPAHDAMGNVTGYPKPSSMTNSYTCKYDAWNRLVEVKDGGTLVAAYVYDGLGRRITKKTYTSGSLTETRQFYYTNRWQDIEERVDERTNDLERQYVWGIGYVDELILRDRDTADDGTPEQRHYALQDANYSVTCIVDSSGDAAERYVYTPYGAREIRSADFSTSLSSSAVGWEIGHQGLMHDTNTSLVYNRYRMLHPGLGRFMQRDPLGYIDGMSLYEYARGAPILFGDAHGLNVKCVGIGATAVVAVGAQANLMMCHDHCGNWGVFAGGGVRAGVDVGVSAGGEVSDGNLTGFGGIGADVSGGYGPIGGSVSSNGVGGNVSAGPDMGTNIGASMGIGGARYLWGNKAQWTDCDECIGKLAEIYKQKLKECYDDNEKDYQDCKNDFFERAKLRRQGLALTPFDVESCMKLAKQKEKKCIARAERFGKKHGIIP
jgi:RHS repeat-associated protein